MDRRRFLTLTGASVGQLALQSLVAPEVVDASTTIGSVLRPATVDQLDTITTALRRLDDQRGSGDTLLAAAQTQLRYATDLLKSCRYNDALGRRLHSSVGELARLAGSLLFDSGRHAHGQRYWSAALRHAHAAGDRALGANILGWLSCQAKDLARNTQQARSAVILAEAAFGRHPGASPRVSAILNLRAAEAHAAAADPTASMRAIDRAFSRLDDQPTSTGDAPWSYWMTREHAHAQAGFCHLRLRNWQGARHYLRTSLAEAAPSREAALRRILVATSYARQPLSDLDQVANEAHHAIDTLTTEVTSLRVRSHLAALLTHELRRHHRQPAIHAVMDRFRNL
jgi:hypothetical protein